MFLVGSDYLFLTISGQPRYRPRDIMRSLRFSGDQQVDRINMDVVTYHSTSRADTGPVVG